jgi:DNA processing protein
MSVDRSTTSWLILGHAAGVGAAAARRLLDAFGSIERALAAPDRALSGAGLTAAQLAAIRGVTEADLLVSKAWLAAPGRRLLTLESPAYPQRLRDIPDPPAWLYAEGDIDLAAMPSLAIVGSRNPTRGGEATAREFAAYVAGHGLAIVSGLAAGIDAAAHRGALDAGGATVAVLGTAIDTAYPSGNRALQRQIAADGLVLSEYPPGSPSQAGQFPARNRIISGLSLGTLVVEATRRSGSLITARLAGEQGRSVFAIPGSIHNPLAKGCHQLIRQGATLVEEAADVFAEIAGEFSAAAPPQAAAGAPQSAATAPARAPDADYEKLLAALGWEPVTVDTLAERSGLTIDELSSMLLILELEGTVEACPGGRFTRIATGRAST